MRGKEYLELAREFVTGSAERHWRGAVGRAYYAIMLEAREALLRWGIVMNRRDNVHTFTRLRFVYPADPDLKKIGDALDMLGQWRNQADYYLGAVALFASDARAFQAIGEAANAVALLEAIDTDPVRQAASIAAIRAAFP